MVWTAARVIKCFNFKKHMTKSKSKRIRASEKERRKREEMKARKNSAATTLQAAARRKSKRRAATQQAQFEDHHRWLKTMRAAANAGFGVDDMVDEDTPFMPPLPLRNKAMGKGQVSIVNNPRRRRSPLATSPTRR